MTDRSRATGVPPATMAVLMLSVFTVSIGYGVVLPLLPYLLQRLLGASASVAQVSRSTGLLTALYTLSLFLFAPAWGWMSDRFGRRPILLLGLIGFGATTMTAAFIERLPAVYIERFLSGVFAAAVTPVALAAIGDLVTTETARARQLTFVSLAGISGFLIGPILGVFVARGGATILATASPAGSLTFPLAGSAILAFLVAIGVAAAAPGKPPGAAASDAHRVTAQSGRGLVPTLLALAFIVSAGVGVFEVGLALRGKQELGLTQYQIAMMFTECSLVMFVVQAAVFSPWVRPESTRWFIAPALGVLAAGLLLVPRATDFRLMLVVIGAVAASAGILSPILTYWVSSKAGATQAADLGKQTAASGLGVTVGSAAGGLLFQVSWLADASFVLITALTGVGFLLSLGLANRLARPPLNAAPPVGAPRSSA
jgi:MFS family permease